MHYGSCSLLVIIAVLQIADIPSTANSLSWKELFRPSKKNDTQIAFDLAKRILDKMEKKFAKLVSVNVYKDLLKNGSWTTEYNDMIVKQKKYIPKEKIDLLFTMVRTFGKYLKDMQKSIYSFYDAGLRDFPLVLADFKSFYRNGYQKKTNTTKTPRNVGRKMERGKTPD